MRTKRFCFMVLLLSCFFLNNCGSLDDCPCVKKFTIRGVVFDEAGNPIPDADVVSVDHYGETHTKAKKTKSDGTYLFSRGRYSGLGNEHVVFRKEGYQEVSTQANPIGSGNGCHDQIIIRDAVMKVKP